MEIKKYINNLKDLGIITDTQDPNNCTVVEYGTRIRIKRTIEKYRELVKEKGITDLVTLQMLSCDDINLIKDELIKCIKHTEQAYKEQNLSGTGNNRTLYVDN